MILKNIKTLSTQHLIAVIAIVFGILTIKSGGAVLFVDGSSRQEAGAYVPFVLWFNFCAGFLYIVAGVGVWLQRAWSFWLAIFLVTCTVLVFSLLGIYILSGGEYEVRTILAMSLRSVVWGLIALFAYKKFAYKKFVYKELTYEKFT